MKRFSLVIAAAAAATAVIVLMSASGSAQDPAVQTIQLVEGEGSFRYVDNPPKSRRPRRAEPTPSTGDLFAFTAPLTNPQNQRVGRLHVECTVTRGARRFSQSASQCEGTYALADGTLAISALLAGEPDPVTFAVTGGTGAYEGRRGSGTSKSRTGRSELSDATIRLLP